MLLMGKSTISMAIFNSYVKLPEGNPKVEIISLNCCGFHQVAGNDRGKVTRKRRASEAAGIDALS